MIIDLFLNYVENMLPTSVCARLRVPFWNLVWAADNRLNPSMDVLPVVKGRPIDYA